MFIESPIDWINTRTTRNKVRSGGHRNYFTLRPDRMTSVCLRQETLYSSSRYIRFCDIYVDGLSHKYNFEKEYSK